MKPLPSIVLVGVSVLGAPNVRAQDAEGPIAGVRLVCNYGDYGPIQTESADILASEDLVYPPSAASSVRLDNEKNKHVELGVTSGHFAECIYPNGDSVRVKVGVGTPRAYGMCGGDSEIFLSLWVNQRKVDSRVWFAGHCNEAGPLSYSVFEGGVRKCQGAKVEDPTTTDVASPEACVRFPATERFPIDEIEYPKGRKPQVGSIEIRSGEDSVCHAVQQELASKWYAFRGSGEPLSFENPTFNESNVEFHKQLRGSRESDFDFDNDGAPNRVFAKQFESNYMHGSTLLIDPAIDSASNLASGWFLPCQFDTNSIPLGQCPPFTQANQEAGFSMANPGGDVVYFRARYSHVTPIRYHGTTYVSVASESADTSDFIAVLKPQRDRSFERTCLLRKVPQNF